MTLEPADPCPDCKGKMVWDEDAQDYRHVNTADGHCWLGRHEQEKT